VRPVDVLRLAYGVVLLVTPAALVRRTGHPSSDLRLRRLARILGARHVAQAVAAATWRTAPARRLGATVDGLHVATDLAWALVDRRRRRLALGDAVLASAFCAGNVVLSGRGAAHR
jgi:hypothetical protein